jgi:hypothetical protein
LRRNQPKPDAAGTAAPSFAGNAKAKTKAKPKPNKL